MSSKLPEDDRLIAFLLDELAEDDRRELEEQCGRDALFEQLLALEDELYDQYARGALPEGRRTVFERKFLSTAEQRRRLAFARTMQNYRSPRPWFAWLRIPQRGMLVPAASLALVLAAAASWQLLHRDNIPVPPVRTLPQPFTVAFALNAGQTRDPGAVKPLVVPIGADFVRLEARLENDTHFGYRASLEAVGGGRIWSQDGLQPQVVDLHRFVAAVVAADLLQNRDYILTVEAASPSGDFSTVAEYSFRIDRR